MLYFGFAPRSWSDDVECPCFIGNKHRTVNGLGQATISLGWCHKLLDSFYIVLVLSSEKACRQCYGTFAHKTGAYKLPLGSLF